MFIGLFSWLKMEMSSPKILYFPQINACLKVHFSSGISIFIYIKKDSGLNLRQGQKILSKATFRPYGYKILVIWDKLVGK